LIQILVAKVVSYSGHIPTRAEDISIQKVAIKVCRKIPYVLPISDLMCVCGSIVLWWHLWRKITLENSAGLVWAPGEVPRVGPRRSTSCGPQEQ